jgi:hypothetical protein
MYLIKSKLSPVTLPLCSREGTYPKRQRRSVKIVNGEHGLEVARENRKELDEQMMDELEYVLYRALWMVDLVLVPGRFVLQINGD